MSGPSCGFSGFRCVVRRLHDDREHDRDREEQQRREEPRIADSVAA